MRVLIVKTQEEFEVAPNALKPVEAWLTRYVGKIDYYKAEETYIFELQLRLDQLKAQLAGNTPKQRTEERPRPTDFIPPQPRLGEELIAQEMLTMIMVVMAKNQTEAQQICARRHVKYENVLKLILWYTSYIGTKHQKKLITNAQAEVDQHISQLEAQIAEIEAQLAAIEDQSAVPANTTEMPPSE